jgi:hypothetical protein
MTNCPSFSFNIYHLFELPLSPYFMLMDVSLCILCCYIVPPFSYVP